MFSVTNDIGIKFNARIVRDPKYTRAPIIEFFDSRYTKGFSERGQFVSSYFVDTIFNGNRETGINLFGGVEDWYITAENKKEVLEFIAEWFLTESTKEELKFFLQSY